MFRALSYSWTLVRSCYSPSFTFLAMYQVRRPVFTLSPINLVQLRREHLDGANLYACYSASWQQYFTDQVAYAKVLGSVSRLVVASMAGYWCGRSQMILC